MTESAVPTYDTTLQVVSWSTQQDLLLFDGFLGRHSVLALGVRSLLSLLENSRSTAGSSDSISNCRAGCRNGKVGCGRSEEKYGMDGSRQVECALRRAAGAFDMRTAKL